MKQNARCLPDGQDSNARSESAQLTAHEVKSTGPNPQNSASGLGWVGDWVSITVNAYELNEPEIPNSRQAAFFHLSQVRHCVAKMCLSGESCCLQDPTQRTNLQHCFCFCFLENALLTSHCDFLQAPVSYRKQGSHKSSLQCVDPAGSVLTETTRIAVSNFQA